MFRLSKQEKLYKLQELIADDDEGILDVVHKKSSNDNTENTRLKESFEEINSFYEANQCSPQSGYSNMKEHLLYERLEGFKNSSTKQKNIGDMDRYNLLEDSKTYETFDDILDDDDLGLLDDEEGIYDFNHVSQDRAEADFIARRKKCENFFEYEDNFKSVHSDIKAGLRHIQKFKEDNVHEDRYFLINGMLVYLESIEAEAEVQKFKSGERTRTDGRTQCVFENGTQSNMLYRSLVKQLYKNGMTVSDNNDQLNNDFWKNFSDVTSDDLESGYIYVLRSLSPNPELQKIEDLYKIGVATQSVADRIKNSEKESTYLYAPVHLLMEVECYNLNPSKLESLIHRFFAESCLNIDVFDPSGKRYSPREWFIVPLDIIERVIQLPKKYDLGIKASLRK